MRVYLHGSVPLVLSADFCVFLHYVHVLVRRYLDGLWDGKTSIRGLVNIQLSQSNAQRVMYGTYEKPLVKE